MVNIAIYFGNGGVISHFAGVLFVLLMICTSYMNPSKSWSQEGGWLRERVEDT